MLPNNKPFALIPIRFLVTSGEIAPSYSLLSPGLGTGTRNMFVSALGTSRYIGTYIDHPSILQSQKKKKKKAHLITR